MKNFKIRALHILVCLGTGGVESLLLDWIRRLPAGFHFDFLVLYNAERDHLAIENGSLVHVIPREICNKPWMYKYFVEELVLKHDYNVVHYHRFAFGGSLMARMKKIGVPCRIVHSHHTLFQEVSLLKKYSYLPYHWTVNRLLLYLNTTNVLGCSSDAGRFMMGPLWSLQAKCQPLVNGIPLDKFLIRMKSTNRNALCRYFNIPKDAVVIGSFGRMVPVKNQSLLLEAFSILAGRDSKYWLFIGGEGELRQSLERKAQDLGIDHRVLMPGFCDNPIEILGNLFDVFCLPSIAEGLPVSLVEATGAGLFSVCSDTITKDITSYFPNRIKTVSLKSDAADWADALEYGVSKKMSQEDGIRLVQNSPFTIESQLNSLLEIYSHCVSKSEK